jgi:hypothetical protein
MPQGCGSGAGGGERGGGDICANNRFRSGPLPPCAHVPRVHLARQHVGLHAPRHEGAVVLHTRHNAVHVLAGEPGRSKATAHARVGREGTAWGEADTRRRCNVTTATHLSKRRSRCVCGSGAPPARAFRRLYARPPVAWAVRSELVTRGADAHDRAAIAIADAISSARAAVWGCRVQNS